MPGLAVCRGWPWAGVMKTGQVFVSHTSDMARFPRARPFVQAALDGVARAGLAPVDMRYFAARDGRPADYCRRRVSECEVYAAVIGLRYGSLVPGEAVSYTELEFAAASDAGLPRLVFLLDEAACPVDLGEADRGRAEEFRQRLRDSGLVVRTFRSADGLELEVFHALHELAGDGLPAPAKAPRVWNVPSRNADFTGRDRLLDRLHDELAGDGKAVVLARALYGLGGVGKTSVALEYAHRFKADYDLVWWIPAEHPQEASLALGNLAARRGSPGRARLRVEPGSDLAPGGPGGRGGATACPVPGPPQACPGPRPPGCGSAAELAVD